MNLPRWITGAACLSLLAGLILLTPSTSEAAQIAFRNNLKISVQIESASIVNGKVYRGKRLFIKPGAAAAYPAVPPSNFVFSVYDANDPGRELFQGNFKVGQANIFLYILPMGKKATVKTR
jgi:hypothetical protein